MGEQLSDLGEFGVIRRLIERVPMTGKGVLLGPGDDAAVVEVGSTSLLATADLLVEGRHFDLAFSSPADVGFKALAVNISDIAAMGGAPRWATVSIGAPPATPIELLEAIYDGIGEAARAFGVTIIGGDTVGSDALLVGIGLIGGTDHEGTVVTRGGAKEGDSLYVTGSLGAAAAGLALLRAAPRDASAAELLGRFPNLAAAHRRPQPRVREGQAAAAAGAHAMIDISDGLAADVRHLCESSGVGATLSGEPPAAPGVAEVQAWSGGGGSAAESGGDDYELAIALPADRVERLRAAIAPTPLTSIGRFGGDTLPEASGWDAFR